MREALLDTDTISYFFRGENSVIEKVDQYLIEFGQLNISVVTFYEVMNGLLFKDARKQLEKFQEFVRLNIVLPLTSEAALKAAQIYAELRKNGEVIGHIDVLIAGIALENDLVLVTNNNKDFGRIQGLKIDNWSSPK